MGFTNNLLQSFIDVPLAGPPVLVLLPQKEQLVVVLDGAKYPLLQAVQLTPFAGSPK